MNIHHFFSSASKNQEINHKMAGAISAGRKIAGIIFAVLTFVTPRVFKPIKIMMSEPVIDI